MDEELELLGLDVDCFVQKGLSHTRCSVIEMAKAGEPGAAARVAGADRKRGITLMLLGVFWISPDSVLCR